MKTEETKAVMAINLLKKFARKNSLLNRKLFFKKPYELDKIWRAQFLLIEKPVIYVDQTEKEVYITRTKDIPVAIREKVKLLAEQFEMDFHVRLHTFASEGNWMNMFPNEVSERIDENNRGYTGGLSIGFSPKGPDSDIRTREANKWYDNEKK